jgi:DNA-binding LytR/AlgR family response regulator
MIKAIIIEDEKPAAANLIKKITQVDDAINIQATLSTIEESVQWLSTNSLPELIFLDIHLSDGLSFNIFKEIKITTPVIFTTTYDKYLLEAFELNSIDYLLKPIETPRLYDALEKFRNTKDYYSGNIYNLIQKVNPNNNHTKCRLIARRGLDHIPLKTEDIVLFYTENRLTFLIDKYGKKYIVDHILSDLENDLDKSKFYRANRQYIINIEFIKGYKTTEKVKISVEMVVDTDKFPITISQDSAAGFREWIAKV